MVPDTVGNNRRGEISPLPTRLWPSSSPPLRISRRRLPRRLLHTSHGSITRLREDYTVKETSVVVFMLCLVVVFLFCFAATAGILSAAFRSFFAHHWPHTFRSFCCSKNQNSRDYSERLLSYYHGLDSRSGSGRDRPFRCDFWWRSCGALMFRFRVDQDTRQG